MQNHGTAVLVNPETPTSDAPAVFGLTYGELAVVLYASGLPTRAMRGVPRVELIEWAAQGLDRIGAELAWWTDYRSRRIRGANPWTAEDRARYAQLWPSLMRHSAAHDAAARITRVCAPDAAEHPWPGTHGGLVPVEVPTSEPGYWYQYMVPARDLELAARYPARAQADNHLRRLLHWRTTATMHRTWDRMESEARAAARDGSAVAA